MNSFCFRKLSHLQLININLTKGLYFKLNLKTKKQTVQIVGIPFYYSSHTHLGLLKIHRKVDPCRCNDNVLVGPFVIRIHLTYDHMRTFRHQDFEVRTLCKFYSLEHVVGFFKTKWSRPHSGDFDVVIVVEFIETTFISFRSKTFCDLKENVYLRPQY